MIGQDARRSRLSCASISRRTLVLGAAIVLGTGGCTTTTGGLTRDSSPEARRAAVVERVNARWAALAKGDLETAYAMLSPVSRETVTLAAFKARQGLVQWRGATIESIACDAESCKVELKATYDYPMQGTMVKGIQTPVSETWVLDQGAAWLVFM